MWAEIGDSSISERTAPDAAGDIKSVIVMPTLYTIHLNCHEVNCYSALFIIRKIEL